MKFTVGWLRDYLDFNFNVEELCNKLTEIGLEVENVSDPTNNLEKFLVVKIDKLHPHPNADKLSLCEVSTGKDNLKIVCGAKNAKKGLLTVLAPVGTKIYPGTNDEFVIKRSRIRGEESFGMLCSEEELGLSDSSEGIIELSSKINVGQKFSDYLDDEHICIEIAITPNRVDCASVYGVARDLAASGFGNLKKKAIVKIDNLVNLKINLKNELKNDDCPKFSLRLIKNVKNSDSSLKIQKRFLKSDIKLISTLVDITNYITTDYCRPLHVFDFDKIKGDITIRHSKKGEKFTGLDGEGYILDDNMIVICDDSGVISLAGILGGLSTACDHNTKNVLIESAYFIPDSIASTGRKLNIQSDARYRFERGIDPESVTDGLEIASEMIIKECGGEASNIISDSVEINSSNFIEIEKTYFIEMLGVEISEKFIEEKFQKLGCRVKKNEKIFNVKPPSWRGDLKIKEDLVEEIARLYGLENIPSKELKFSDEDQEHKTSAFQKIRNKIRKLLVSRGVFETITWSFTDCSLETLIRGNENLLKIKNPISSDLSCLRSSLLPNLFNVIRKNNNKDIEDLAIFEIGPIFYGKEPGEQDDYLCVIKSGRVNKKNWLEKQRSFDFFDIKADLSATLKCFNVNIENCKFSRDTKSYYHPGKSGSLEFGGKEICFFGEINPSIQNNLGLDNKIFTYELNISELFKFYKIKSNSKKKLDASSFQASKRDFSFEINEDIFSSEVISTIKKINKELIKNVSIFDQYEGEKIKYGKKSLSFEVIIQSDTKTLTESEINEISERIISEVKKKFDAEQR